MQGKASKNILLSVRPLFFLQEWQIIYISYVLYMFGELCMRHYLPC